MKYKKDILEKAVANSVNYSDVTRKLGLKTGCGNRQTVKKYISKFNIDISHFNRKYTNKSNGKLEDYEIFIENSTYNNGYNLKKRLYNNGLKERKCELCGQDELWNGKKMSLILDHINGVHNDNRLENLRIVCPNCNATLDTHCGKNKKQIIKDIKKCKCGNIIKGNGEKCIKCGHKSERKVKWPPYLILIEEIEDLGYCGVGRIYGVSDNAIRKWKKSYEKDFDK